MLIGFIVVIVMILVIVGLMATGNSGGGTGVNQTKATKVVTEIGTLAQSLAFYKTTTNAGDYAGFDQAAAISLLGSTYSSDGNATIDSDFDGTQDAASTEDLVVSQAVPTVLYSFSTNTAADELNIDFILSGSDNDLNQAVGSTVSSKLDSGNMSVATEQATAGKFVQNDQVRVVTK